MTYYIAEIRFNRKNRNLKRDGRMRKRLTVYLTTLLLIFLVFSTSIMIMSVSACQRRRSRGNEEEKEIIKSLRQLYSDISDLPDEAFVNPCKASWQRKVLLTKVSVVIWQVKVGAYEGALNNLENDIKEKIERWIVNPWKSNLIEKVEHIIGLLKKLLWRRDRNPPTILTVHRDPETPNYDENVTIIAQVIDDKSGVKSVILSHQVNSGSWTNTTMSNIIDGLYIAEIPHQPYNSAVNYKVYAYDWAGNPATPETDSYVVIDSYKPEISYVDRDPASPYYNEDVTVSANVTEPPEASGVKNVTLLYKTDGEWQSVGMTLDKLYTGTIPASSYGTVVQYRVRAFDYADNLAASGIYSYTVGAPPNRPPVAKFTESAETVYTGEVISFDASESYDPDGSIISYFWDFGDGTNATDVLLVKHAYAEDGNYAVILTVTDDDGLTGMSISTKKVLNRPPVASFTESATEVLTGETINFDASGSNDPDGHIIYYLWNFGDGNNADGVSVSHAYEDNGTYTVTLTVIDDDGATASKSTVKTVSNRPPISYFTENATSVNKRETIHFDASESYDLDGSIVRHFWDFGDGTSATGVTADHAYADDGNYIVTLTVTDDDGATDTFTSIKNVLNKPPVARLAKNATTVKEKEFIHFDASESYDPDGSIVSYFWDFGDGASSTDVAVDHAYAENGNYTVTLTVTDDDGAYDSVSTKIIVGAKAGQPLALFAAIGLGIAALTATLLYALYRRRKKGKSVANPGNTVNPTPVVTLYIPAKLLSRFEIKPLKLRKS